MGSKHAYLIIAHTDYELLQCLVYCLDDNRNDIYIHIDKKADFDGKGLCAHYSKLVILAERMDVRWGDYSMVEAELLLFETASSYANYAYYHLLSGVDLPIKPQNYIHGYCDKHQGTEFVGFAQNVTLQELRWRTQNYFLFSKDFQSKSLWKRGLRALFVLLQRMAGCRRIRCEVKKGAQWCSVTHEFVQYLLSRKEYIRKYFKGTYCPDELVIQTLCWNSSFREKVCNASDEFEGCKRYIKWKDGELLPVTASDIDEMLDSDKWFARKFSSENYSVISVLTKGVSKHSRKQFSK